MSEKTRTEHSARNAIVAFIGKILVLLFAYGQRVVFVHVLSQVFVGTNGYLNNVLGVFALTSLAIDTALVFMLYKPVAENDFARQRALMYVYNRIHLITGALVAALSAVMYFLMPVIAKDALGIPNFTLCYWLFAGNVIMSYVFSHKSMIFIATQQNYINEIFESVQLILQYVVQCVVLVVTKNFVLYTFIYFISIIIKNIALTAYANKKYPYLKEKNTEKLPQEDRRTIRKNLWAILVQKFGVKIINYSDTIMLSGLCGMTSLAKYTNYSLIIISIRQLMERVVYGIMGSVGNLNVTTDRKSVEKIYNASLFLTIAMFGVISAVLYEVLDLFVQVSFGKAYIYSNAITLVLCINLYLNGIRIITNVFRSSLGIFWNDRYRSIIESVANVVFSLGSFFIFGEIGIFLGTTFSLLTVPLWVEPFVLYKNYFEKPLRTYFARIAVYTVVVAAGAVAAHFLCLLIPGPIILKMILRALCVCFVTGTLEIAVFRRTDEFKLLRNSFGELAGKRFKFINRFIPVKQPQADYSAHKLIEETGTRISEAKYKKARELYEKAETEIKEKQIELSDADMSLMKEYKEILALCTPEIITDWDSALAALESLIANGDLEAAESRKNELLDSLIRGNELTAEQYGRFCRARIMLLTMDNQGISN